MFEINLKDVKLAPEITFQDLANRTEGYSGADLSRLPSALETRLRSGRYTQAVVGACAAPDASAFSTYSIAVLLY